MKVLGNSGFGSSSLTVGAIDWITTKHTSSGSGPAVLRMSLGCGFPCQDLAQKSAIDEATSRGLTVVQAAGNSDDDACQSGLRPKRDHGRRYHVQ